MENKIKIGIAEAMPLLNAISVLRKIGTESELHITTNKLSMVFMDPTNVSMCIFELEPSHCIEYKVTENHKFLINLEGLYKKLKTLIKNDRVLNIEYQEGDNLLFTSIGNTKSRTNLKLLDMSDYKEQKVPELKHNSQIVMDSKVFRDSIKELQEHGKNSTFHLNKVFEMSILNDSGEKYAIEPETEIKKQSTEISKFRIEYLSKFIDSYKIADTVLINLSTEYPLVLEYNSLDCYKLKFILAPRVENE